ncbi:hypothetical protein [Microvirga tunisiensis]|uniref:Uncharacterized protein n=1 Tax=Microvirga tunisiensis TaxID=2108360 RepID=A0A5N7MHL9_9HYPH|nr:hypothetical protein [Microvirga tunisiensis]MPR07686.1 hypothetical protein [Microvirga tunisiensis]MPR25889.1 hypothetical protein [Microvirga tunisiensis]
MDVSIEAIPIANVLGVSTTVDGSYILVRFGADNHQELVLALPYDVGFGLLRASSVALGEALRRKVDDPTSVLVTPLEWWEFQSLKDEKVLLSLRQPGGLATHHILPRSEASHMRNVLSAVLQDGRKQDLSNPMN